jgi:hypothetical protein
MKNNGFVKLLDSEIYREDIKRLAQSNFDWNKLKNKRILITGCS